MADYRVVWEMDISADTPREAAEQAFRYMQLPGTTANAFDVFDEKGEACHVDLMDSEFPRPEDECTMGPTWE